MKWWCDRKGTDVVRLTVRDHGPGIPVDFKPLIFEKFAQADATNARQKGGTGLGLSIVKQIVDRLGGEVGFADAPGGGTIFHVQLPCWAIHEAVKGRLPVAVHRFFNSIKNSSSSSKMTLGTHVFFRKMLNEQTSFNTQLTQVECMSDAETHLGKHAVDIILFDLGLPDVPGLEAIRRAHAAAPGVPWWC